MNIDDTSLVRELTESFSSQVNTYCELKALVQKMMGKLILSRGDFTGLMGSMEQKKRLLDSIEHNQGRPRHSARLCTSGRLQSRPDPRPHPRRGLPLSHPFGE